MRRSIIVSISIAVVAMLLSAAPASAARIRSYAGETSAGTTIGFRIRVAADGRMSMKGLRFDAELLCEDATTIGYSASWGFTGAGLRLDGRRLTFDDVFYYEALHVTGIFRGRTADGTFENTWASLTDTEEAQLCTTGELTWMADRVPRDRWARLASSGEPDLVHRVRGDRVLSVRQAAGGRA